MKINRQEAFPQLPDNTQKYLQRYFWGRGKNEQQIKDLIAQKRAIFQKEGLDVDVVQALSSICIAGLVSKSIDYTTTFGSDVMSASLKGLPVRGLMAMHTGSDYGFLARKDIADFKGFENTEAVFLRFGKNFLSNGYSDPYNNPSLRSCLLRIPNSLNSKCLTKQSGSEQAMVRVVNQWDYKRPSIGNLMGSFYNFLVSERIKSERRINRPGYCNKKRPNHEIQWIENLLQTPLKDHRKYCLWRILVPYLLNVRKLPVVEVGLLLETWCMKSNYIRKLDFDPHKKIKENIRNARDYLPVSKVKLKGDNIEIYNIIIQLN